MASALNQHVENTRQVQVKQTALQMKEFALNDLNTRLNRSKDNQEKNMIAEILERFPQAKVTSTTFH